MKIQLAKDRSPPWAIFAESGQHPTRPSKALMVMPAGRPGDVANVEHVPDGVVKEVVRSVNDGTMTTSQALSVFQFHKEKAGIRYWIVAYRYDDEETIEVWPALSSGEVLEAENAGQALDLFYEHGPKMPEDRKCRGERAWLIADWMLRSGV